MLRTIPAVACICVLLAALTACSRDSDETLIREALDSAVDAIEKKEPKRVLERVADNFRGPGDLTRDGARRILAYQLLRNQNIKVFIAGARVEVKGQEASMRFKATVTGAEGLIPDRIEHYDVELGWWKDKNGWWIVSAQWEPVFGN